VRNLESRGEPVCSPRFRRVRPDFGVFAPISACSPRFRRVRPDFGVFAPISAYSPLLCIRALYHAIQTQRVLTYLAPR